MPRSGRTLRWALCRGGRVVSEITWLRGLGLYGKRELRRGAAPIPPGWLGRGSARDRAPKAAAPWRRPLPGRRGVTGGTRSRHPSPEQMVPRQQSCPFRIDYPGRPFNDRFPRLIKLSSPRAAVPACSPDAAPQNGGDEPVAGTGVCFQVKSLYPSWSAPWLRLLLPGAPGARSAAESGCIPLSGQLGGWSRGCPMFSPDRCFFWEPSPPPRSVGLGLRPPMPLFTMILEEGVESSAADGGSGAARVAERVAALRLSGVAAFCISKCALSAGALGRNCHLLPHCQPRRGYASFADSQPPALITRSTPSLEPPGQSRHIPSRCCTAGRRAGAGASMQSPSLHPSLPAGIAPPLRVQLRATALVCSGIPLLARLAWFWGATGFCSWAIHANPPPCAHPCPWESPKSFSPGCLLQLPTLTPP